MLTDLAWGVGFFVLGALLLSASPATDPLLFLIAGWAALLLGVLGVCRFVMDRMDNPLEEPWVNPLDRWGDP